MSAGARIVVGFVFAAVLGCVAAVIGAPVWLLFPAAALLCLVVLPWMLVRRPGE
jgi:hypothetical protein